MKRLCMVLLALQCLLLSACITISDSRPEAFGFAPSSAAEPSDSSLGTKRNRKYLNLEYNILPDDAAEVVGYSGSGNCANIEMSYKGHTVVGIADSAFEDCAVLETVQCWAPLERIGDSAFRNCISLSKMSIPYETTEIGCHAFEGCSSLGSVTVWGGPDIGSYAFAQCTSLTEFSFSYDTKHVGEHAFDGCTSLSSITVWNDDTVFGREAFANCPKLKDKPQEEDIPSAISSEPSAKEDLIQTSIVLRCVENMLFSTYDIDIYIDGEKVGLLKHGEENTYSLSLLNGKHTLKVTDEKDNTVFGCIDFAVAAGAESKFEYKLSCYYDEIKIQTLVPTAQESSSLSSKVLPSATPTSSPSPSPVPTPTPEPEPVVTPEPTQAPITEPQGELVWIPTNGGTKYHRSSSCSNMKNPVQVTRDEAIAQGYTPCKRCY